MERLRKAEATLAVLLTVAAVWLHAVSSTSAGALWRDEANTVGLATLPALRDVWNNLQYDSFPLLWVMLVRMFAEAFGPMNDQTFRVIGFIIGLLVIAVLWFNARSFGNRYPLASLALFALSPSVIRWGDSFRAYGAGLALGLLTCGLLWRFVKAPTRRNLAIAAAVAMLSVHTLYYNALVLLAFGAGAIAVFGLRRDWKSAFAIAVLGLVAAISLVPYATTIGKASSWNSVVQIPDYDTWWFLMKLGETVNSAGAWAFPVWIGVILLALWAAYRETTGSRSTSDPPIDRELVTFACVALVVGVVANIVFLRLLSYLTQPWYYLTLLATIAVCLEMLSAALIRKPSARVVRLAAVTVIAVATIPHAIPELHRRMTNVDAIASALESQARAGDLIIVNPWYTGVTFGRYYAGPASWTMLPAFSFSRFHKYDQLQNAMQEPDQASPAQPVIRSAERVLRAGRSVYIVGGLPGADRVPGGILPAARIPEDGWKSPRYQRQWAWMLEQFLREHATTLTVMARDTTPPISEYEDVPLVAASGWKD